MRIRENKLLTFLPTVKYGIVSVLICGAVWFNVDECFGDINSEKYIHILQECLMPIFPSDQTETEKMTTNISWKIKLRLIAQKKTEE